MVVELKKNIQYFISAGVEVRGREMPLAWAVDCLVSLLALR